MWVPILIFITIFITIFAVKGLKIVQQAETVIIERLGRYNRTLESGVNIIWPIIDKPRPIEWRYKVKTAEGDLVKSKLVQRIDLREQVYDFPRQNVITRDNVSIEIDALLYFQVTDPVKSVYEIANLPEAIEKLTQTTLRNVIGELDLDECLTSRDTVNMKLRTILDEATDKWGVKVNRVELQDITPPPDVQAAMEKQMRAERDRRASILNAEGEKRARILESEGLKESAINKAEGHKRSTILKAEGDAEARLRMAQAEADAIKKVTDAVAATVSDPTQYLIAVRYLETLKEMTSGKDNKVVYLPYEATATLGSVGGIKELFAKE